MRVLLTLVLLAAPVAAWSQPEALAPGIALREVPIHPGGLPVRIAHDPASGALWLTTFSDALVRIDPPFDGTTAPTLIPFETHGTPVLRGLAVGADGAIYLMGNDRQETVTSGVVRRGTQTDGEWTWEDVARTEPYPRGQGPYDHLFGSLTITASGDSLLLASGSRSDHGEVQDASGLYPGLREVAITSALLRIPISARGLVLPNDEAALRASDFFFADGVRNAFDLAYDASGDLFGIDNAGDRDDGEELNWLRKGHHYGFPWRIGVNDTPQRDPGYDPDTDALINDQSFAYQNGYFTTDPSYPAPPEGVTFTDPIRNIGPDADAYRDASGAIRDASEDGAPFASFTPHRSPLGLVFDASGALPAPFTRDGFVLSWTSLLDPLLAPFGDPSEDLLHLRIAADRQSMSATRIVGGFRNPVDAVLVGRTLYVIEFGATTGFWAVEFTDDTTSEPPPEAGLRLSVAPNPSRGDAQITIAGAAGDVRLTLVDALGRDVATLHRGPLMGERTIALPAGLAPGVYRVWASGGDTVTSRALTVAR